MNKVLSIIIFFTLTHETFAAGGFEKPVLWSARAARQGGAYAANVQGSEAVLFNPSGLFAKKNDLTVAVGALGGLTKAPLIESHQEKSTQTPPILSPAVLYSRQLDDKNAIGFGIYGVGGLSVNYEDVNLSGLGSEFEDYRPDIYGQLNIAELGVSYARKISEKLKAGLTLKAQYATGSFGQVQVSRAKGLGGLGVDDGTVLAVSNAEFKNLTGHAFGAMFGLQYTPSSRWGLGITYRTTSNYNLKSSGGGRVVYSNTGATSSGATAGREYKLTTSQTTISSSLPMAGSLSGYYKLSEAQTVFLEYTLTNYSANRNLETSGRIKNPVDNSESRLADTKLRWHNMHDFKTGWTTKFAETWDAGLGYSLTLPVTDRKTTGPTFAAPGNYHHFYSGVGKMFTRFRADFAAEYYVGEGKGSTQVYATTNQISPSVKGQHTTRAYSFYLSGSIPF